MIALQVPSDDQLKRSGFSTYQRKLKITTK